jgi:cytochrome o ubiquinol oxidase subunit 3
MSRAHQDPVPFGLWVYILSDCVLFASLFAAYAVLQGETAGGPSSHMLFDRSFALLETLVLLASSFTCGLALVAGRWRSRAGVVLALLGTVALGGVFLALELSEFASLVREGAGWQASAFLSAFFTLVGTHGLHIFVGMVWMLVLLAHLARSGLTPRTTHRIMYFSLFWHFLDIVWICIFSLVYLLGTFPV